MEETILLQNTYLQIFTKLSQPPEANLFTVVVPAVLSHIVVPGAHETVLHPSCSKKT